jgi:hypothetical protein
MTTTTLMPLEPAASPQRVARVLTISANLLPEEIVAGRRARRSRTWVLVALALVVLLLAGWYLLAYNDRGDATQELDNVTAETATAQRNQNRYREVVEVRNETDTLTKELKTLLADDLPYSTLLSKLRSTGKAAGITVIGVTASLNTGAGAAVATTAGSVLPSDTTAATVGTLVIAGSGPNKPAVAAYADKLNVLGIVANPYVTSVTATTAGLSFSLSAEITSTAVCGRFIDLCKTTGGK